jgi:hypothetical protein
MQVGLVKLGGVGMVTSDRRGILEKIIRAFVNAKTDEEREKAILDYRNDFGGRNDYTDSISDKMDAFMTHLKTRMFPRPLYKYIMFDDNGYWKEFFEGRLKLSPPKIWNDLADSMCVFERADEYSEYHENIRVAFQKNQYATCFSEQNNNMPMWYHYAGMHSGMVVSYDFSRLLRPQNLLPIVYADDIKISVETIEKYVVDGDIHLPFFPMLVKSKQWEYEAEWRLFGGYDEIGGISGFLEMKPAMTEVFFGVRTKIENICMVLNLIDLNFDSATKPRLLKMKIDNTKNELIAQPLFPDKDTENIMWQFIKTIG